MDYAKIAQLREELESLGCVVIIWTPDDFPGEDDEEKDINFDNCVDAVVDICTERGNEAIAQICG